MLLFLFRVREVLEVTEYHQKYINIKPFQEFLFKLWDLTNNKSTVPQQQQQKYTQKKDNVWLHCLPFNFPVNITNNLN